jgi:moderate conductance mechanosensitive channel
VVDVLAAEDPEWVQRLDELHLLTPLRVLAIIVAAVVLTILTRLVVRRLARKVMPFPGLDPARAQVRQQALGTVLRSTIVGFIWATAIIAVVSAAGVNVGGLVATATVVGGAIAFGAQTLIRDAIAGFFVLAEDQYGVGEVVDVGHAEGVVERITLRSVRLRDGEGRVWHVPHGGVARTANLSKAPKVLMDINVSRTMTLDTLDAAAAELCDALGRDEEVVQSLLARPECDGVIEVADDRLVYRMSVLAARSQHDRIRAEWRSLVLRAFESGALVAPPPRPT